MNPLRIFLLAALILVVFGNLEAEASMKWNYDVGDDVQSVAISADGEYIVSGSRDKAIHLFSKNSSTPLWTYSADSYMRSVAISANNSQYIVAGSSYNDIYLFNRDSSIPLWIYESEDDVNSVAISAEGENIVAGSEDNNIYFFSKDNSTPLWNYDAGGAVLTVEISNNGEHIVAASKDDSIYFFDKDNGFLWSYDTGYEINSVDISADGDHIIASFSNQIRVFDKDGENIGYYIIESEYNVNSVAVSADGEYIVAGSDDKKVYLFNIYAELIWYFTTGFDVTLVDISADGEYLIAGCLSSQDSELSRFFLFNKHYDTPLETETIKSDIYSLAISANGEYIAVGTYDSGDWSSSGRLYLFDSFSNLPNYMLWNYMDVDSKVHSVDTTADGEYSVVGFSNMIHLFYDDEGVLLWSYNIGDSIVDEVAISADGEYIVAGDSEGMIYLFHQTNNEPLWTYSGNGNDVRSIAISADGEDITVHISGEVLLFDKDNSNPRWSSTVGGAGSGGGAGSRSVDIMPNGEYLSVVGGDSVYLFDEDGEGSPVWSYTNGNYMYSTAISDNDEYIVAGDRNGIHLLDHDGDLLWSHNTGDYFWSVDISSNGQYIAAVSIDDDNPYYPYGIVYLYDKSSNTPLWTYSSSEENIKTVSISANGGYIVAGGDTGFVYCFSRQSSNPLWIYDSGRIYADRHQNDKHSEYDYPISIAISADHRYVITGNYDGKVHYFLNNMRPIATIDSITPSPAKFYENVYFEGNGFDSDGLILMYEWKSDIDGFLSNQETFTVTNLTIGTHIISLRVIDNNGAWSEPTIAEFYVEPSPLPDAHFTWSYTSDGEVFNQSALEGFPTNFDASLSSGYNLVYEWDFGDGSTATGPFVSHTYDYKEDGFDVTLTVIDQLGNSDSMSYRIIPALKARPDIYISSLSFSNDNPIEGESIEIAATIKLLGMEVTGNFEVGFFLGSMDGESIGSVTVNGANIESGYLASITWIAVQGQHTIYVIADSTNVVDENEEKNDISKSIIVKDEEENTSPSCQNGDTKDADDDCNQCVCSEGEWICTEVACNPDDKDEGKDEDDSNISVPSLSLIPVLISIGLLAIFRRK